MAQTNDLPKLKLLPYAQYAGVDKNDPLRFYYRPVIGKMYRRRIEMCLARCKGGERILEVGFGAGVTFLNLHELYQEIHGLDLNASVEEVAAVFEARQIETRLVNGDVLSMPYADDFFDTVLLISILEHLKPSEQVPAFEEIRRVLKPQGQVVYGVPIERRLMVLAFRVMGFDIRQHHFSTEKDVADAAGSVLEKVQVVQMRSIPSLFGPVYEVGHFVKSGST
ncbi:MAG TPA: class I SAM-dependent methyltransferase [Sedimentisphaerales bacterium]|nr:class I SAM-dependent methyltransferase [Sedimentisphaerales bacterium]